MPVATKICGITTPDALAAALDGGAAYIGFVFVPASPRNISPDDAASLVREIQGRAKVVGLFVNPADAVLSRVLSVVPLDIIQLHGEESPGLATHIGEATGLPIWKAVPVRKAVDLGLAEHYVGVASQIVYDAKAALGMNMPGGNGLRFDWEILRGHRHPLPWILSGGLNAENIAEAVQVTGARVLDVSSGVESTPGVKDVDKIREFLQVAGEL